MTASPPESFMRRAFELARRGLGRVSPNPIVGAVAVRSGKIVGEGHHAQYGGPHAEADLIANAASASLRGADLYVSLEPCSHHGKTPPCTDAVIAAGIARVVFSVEDPNPATAGGAERAFSAAGIPFESGLLAVEGRRLIAPYLKRVRTGRPLVTAKWAMTLDGKIATATGHARWVSSPEMRGMTRAQRHTIDAILVGAGTVRADDPLLLGPDSDLPQPLRVVVDPRLEISPESTLARTTDDGPVLVVTRSGHGADVRTPLERRGVEVWEGTTTADGWIDLGSLLDELGRRGVCDLLVEGGQGVHGAFFDARLVDRVTVIIAPKIAGGERAPSPVGGLGVRAMDEAIALRHAEFESWGDDLCWTGDLTPAAAGDESGRESGEE